MAYKLNFINNIRCEVRVEKYSLIRGTCEKINSWYEVWIIQSLQVYTFWEGCMLLTLRDIEQCRIKEGMHSLMEMLSQWGTFWRCWANKAFYSADVIVSVKQFKVWCWFVKRWCVGWQNGDLIEKYKFDRIRLTEHEAHRSQHHTPNGMFHGLPPFYFNAVLENVR